MSYATLGAMRAAQAPASGDTLRYPNLVIVNPYRMASTRIENPLAVTVYGGTRTVYAGTYKCKAPKTVFVTLQDRTVKRFDGQEFVQVYGARGMRYGASVMGSDGAYEEIMGENALTKKWFGVPRWIVGVAGAGLAWFGWNKYRS